MATAHDDTWEGQPGLATPLQCLLDRAVIQVSPQTTHDTNLAFLLEEFLTDSGAHPEEMIGSLGVTLVVLVLLVASALIVVVTGTLAAKVGHALGIGSAAVTAWNIAKWPVLLIIVSVMFAILYWASPNARHGFRLVSPGSVLAVALWLIASGLFALYVANFGSYNKVYGSLAAVIIFLIWMWISNTAILIGAEFNAELERGRAIASGLPPDQEPFTELRDTRKLPADEEAGTRPRSRN